MKVFKNKITGRLGETQFGEDIEVLIRNAKQYYSDSEIEIIDMTLQEYKEAILIQNNNDKTPEQIKEDKIKKEMENVLRELAIKNLKNKGEI